MLHVPVQTSKITMITVILVHVQGAGVFPHDQPEEHEAPGPVFGDRSHSWASMIRRLQKHLVQCPKLNLTWSYLGWHTDYLWPGCLQRVPLSNISSTISRHPLPYSEYPQSHLNERSRHECELPDGNERRPAACMGSPVLDNHLFQARDPSDFLNRPPYPQAMLFVEQTVDSRDEMNTGTLHPPVRIQPFQQDAEVREDSECFWRLLFEQAEVVFGNRIDPDEDVGRFKGLSVAVAGHGERLAQFRNAGGVYAPGMLIRDSPTDQILKLPKTILLARLTLTQLMSSCAGSENGTQVPGYECLLCHRHDRTRALDQKQPLRYVVLSYEEEVARLPRFG